MTTFEVAATFAAGTILIGCLVGIAYQAVKHTEREP